MTSHFFIIKDKPKALSFQVREPGQEESYSPFVYLDGVLMREGSDYTIDAQGILMFEWFISPLKKTNPWYMRLLFNRPKYTFISRHIMVSVSRPNIFVREIPSAESFRVSEDQTIGTVH